MLVPRAWPRRERFCIRPHARLLPLGQIRRIRSAAAPRLGEPQRARRARSDMAAARALAQSATRRLGMRQM